MIEKLLIDMLNREVDTTLPVVTKNTGLIQVYRKIDGILVDERYFNGVGAAKLMIRNKYYGIRFNWAFHTFGKDWWSLDYDQRKVYEDQEDELFQYAYTLFEFRKVL